MKPTLAQWMLWLMAFECLLASGAYFRQHNAKLAIYWALIAAIDVVASTF